MDMVLKAPQAPLVEPEKPAPPEDPFKPDPPVIPGKKAKPPKQKRKHHVIRKLFVTLLVFVLVGGAAYGVYYWQHQQLDKFAKQVQGLTAYVFKLQDENTKLQQENETLTKAAAINTKPPVDQQVLTAVKDYCQAAVDPKTKKSLEFIAGTSGPDKKAVLYSTDKTFAQVNGACIANANDKDGAKAYIVKYSGISWVVVTSGTAADPTTTALYGIPTTFN